MNDCSFESATARAARTGEWPPELKTHFADCAACRQAQSVTAFMSRVASGFASEEPTPDPTRIWVRSQLMRHGEEDRRSRNLRRWSLGLTGLAGALCFWAMLRWLSPIIADNADTFGIAGASVGFSALVLYLVAFRPLKNAR